MQTHPGFPRVGIYLKKVVIKGLYHQNTFSLACTNIFRQAKFVSITLNCTLQNGHS